MTDETPEATGRDRFPKPQEGEMQAEANPSPGADPWACVVCTKCDVVRVSGARNPARRDCKCGGVLMSLSEMQSLARGASGKDDAERVADAVLKELLGRKLPDLEGVETVDHQIDICRQKAGIAPHEPVNLHRFQVRRYK